jgi:fatty acid-binding protein DegV
MRIKPVLQIKGERLDAFSKARTLAQGKSTMINAIHHDIDNLFGGIDAENVYMYAVHAQVPEPFAVFKKEVADAFPKYKVEEDRLSLSICCHIGPGALAMGCVKKCPELN